MVLPAGDLGNAVLQIKKTSILISWIVRTYVSGMPGHDAAKLPAHQVPRMRVLVMGGLTG